MSVDTIVRRYIDAVNRKDPTAFAALFAVSAVLHDPLFPEPTRGRDAVRTMIEGVLRAFPDMSWTQVADPIEQGGRAAFVVSVEATNEGPLSTPAGELPPTGRTIEYRAAVFWNVGPNGLIAEEHSYFDATGVAAQLGLTG